ncbi:CheR family methyltransferase [Cyclobacterium jeungdonense]|uniref:CheR family methyltransferase n=1 Tax=Cyclobacterium jeungdonense TaxID=708087 RepID=A0ABT8CEW5_9BACT|nr:CheR family methyltransferase [Cyclobacterium jeungdonense]MDN3690133.1 CheR family methyltransferase [Cyclobacterium jeungdonense]
MNKNFPIIGIGASAGGLEPLELFFESVGKQKGYAYVIIQHLAPNHKSLMDELLSRYTHFPIEVIAHETKIHVDHIYLNPPKKFVEIRNGRFLLREKEDRKLSFPISTFFKSLAAYGKEKAAAIVVSGTGSDGSEGIKYIKEGGGLVIAQLPETAKFDGMPRNAIHTNSVDKICEVSQMPDEIRKFFNYDSKKAGSAIDPKSQSEKLSAILDLVNKDTGVSFADYKFSTIYRRTVRRMGVLGLSDMDEYYRYLDKNSPESHQLASELLIGVTRFFRDEDAFEELKREVIPRIIAANSDNKSIRIWVPACSTGEEAYSIAMLLNDYMRSNKVHYDVVIFATDLNKESIKFAGNRIFPESIATELPPEYLKSYFKPQKRGYSVINEIREMIVFSVHNLVQDPPFGKIDLISCRNFLIYLNSAIQNKLFGLFQYALNRDGFLFLGSSESLGRMSDQFLERSARYKIYQNANKKKHGSPIRLSNKPGIEKLLSRNENGRSGSIAKQPSSQSRGMLHEVQEAIIQEFVPDTIVFNEDFDLVHTTGKVIRWIKLPQGVINTNVLRMLPPQLALSVELMTGKVINSEEPAILQNIALDEELKEFYISNENGFLEIEIRKLNAKHPTGLFAATFKVNEDQSPGQKFEVNLGEASIEKISRLERDLRVNQENLQTTIEELESSNEELQASNEELQSSNEELESVNEELYTVNAEYMEKVEELSESNNDLNNLIQSTDIAILFLDNNLTVRKFTPAVKKILSLVPEDIGRHISNFRTKVQLDGFIQKVELVYKDLTPFETTVKGGTNQTLALKITPFLNSKSQVQGVVITFFDISAIFDAKQRISEYHKELENAEVKYLEQHALFELIAKNSSHIICIHDLDGQIEFVSPSVFDLTGIMQKEVLLNGLPAYFPRERDKKQWNTALNSLREGNGSKIIKYKLKRPDDQISWFESNFNVVTDELGNPVKIISNNRDITSRIHIERELEQLSKIISHTHINIVITDTEGRITYANRAFERLTGYSESELLGRVPGELLQGAETSAKTVRNMQTAIANQTGFKTEIINYTKEGQKYWVSIHCEPLFDNDDQDNELIGFIAIQHEASLELDYKFQIQKLNNILKEKNIKLEESNQKLDEFAYIVSHDLKAPLRNINSMIALIEKKRETTASENLDKYFHVMSKAVWEMSRMIESLLEYSRTGRLDEQLEEINISDFENQLLTIFSAEIFDMGGQISCDIPMKKIKVYPILFKRLFTNLLSNAIKYRGDDSPVISISAVEKEDLFFFAIKDNGMGIPSEQFESIFKIFRSLKQDVDNNGIGLAVCKTIVELHEGRIWIESEPGKGSTFYFTIKKFQ